MKRLIAIAVAAFAFANVASAQVATEQAAAPKSVEQTQAFDYLVKYSPL